MSDKRFNHDIDEKFLTHFDKKLKQVFFYVTDDCQLRCKQCLVKPNLIYHMKGRKDIPLAELNMLAQDFRELGAKKHLFSVVSHRNMEMTNINNWVHL